jgi:DNA-binding NarL/FixJ family response regulator
MMKADFKILVIEDEVLVAMYIKEMLTKLGYKVVGIADRMEKAVDLFLVHHPNLVLCDVKIKGENSGIDTIVQLRATGTPFEVIYLTAYADEKTLIQAFGTEPKSYLLKPFTEIQIEVAVSQLYHQTTRDSNLVAGDSPFTERELDILKLLIKGYSSKEISERLAISIDTVRTHRRNMMGKVDAQNSLQLIRISIDKSWIRA